MPMMVRQIHTADSIAAVNKIKSAVRNDGLGLKFEIPKEFLEKRKYMQSDEFLNDEHNTKMFDLCKNLCDIKEQISNLVKQV